MRAQLPWVHAIRHGCTANTEGNGVPDNEDPLPTDPGVTSGFLEDEARETAWPVTPESLALWLR